MAQAIVIEIGAGVRIVGALALLAIASIIVAHDVALTVREARAETITIARGFGIVRLVATVALIVTIDPVTITAVVAVVTARVAWRS
jgi:hypothetical protein